jgi:surfactin synthase thioesterase subunit
MTRSPSRWLLCRRRRPSAPLRMYCFPHSGGSAGEYMRWSDGLDPVEVWGLQPPGRGDRIDEDPVTAMPDLVEALVEQVTFEPPYVFFGHSLGALVAYETARALRDRGRPGPELLCLSAYQAPYLHRPGVPVHELDGPELIDAIEREHGPLPAEVRDDPELQALVLPVLRADLTIVSTYTHVPAEPLDHPLLVLGGSDDRETLDGLATWSRYTTGDCHVEIFPGDHFYFREQTDDVLRFLAARLAELPARALPRPAGLGPALAVS